MKCYTLHYKNNASVTDWYISIVEETLQKKMGIEVIPVYDVSSAENRSYHDWFFVSDIINFFRLWMRGYKNIILWIQGILPEESYSRNRSKIRYKVLCFLEKFALNRAKVIFLVSDAMKAHMEYKYKMSIKNYFIMPCFNEELETEVFKSHNYTGNEFIYIGGLSKWQCIEQTLDLYKKIECMYGNTSLKILTADKQMAQKMVAERNIINYKIDYVSKDEIKNELRKSKFGFCIRENNPINNVSTPTKLSSYICSGVIPIYTSAVYDFANKARDNKFCLLADDESFLSNLKELLDMNISWEDIYDSYKKDFGKYYSRDSYSLEMVEILKSAMRN